MNKFLCLFLLWSFTIQAQVVDIHLSEGIPLRNQDEYQGLIHADSSGYILHFYERMGKGLLRHPGRNLVLEKYSPDFKQVYSYAYGTKDMISIELVSVGTQLIWIVLEKTGSYTYSYSMIPIYLDGSEGQKRELFEIEVGKAIDIPYTYIRLSPDLSSVAFIAEFDADKRRRKTEIYAAVFDTKSDLVWGKFTTLKGNQKQYNIMDYQLNSQNELLVFAKYYKDGRAKQKVKDKKGEKVAGYEAYLYIISEDSKVPAKHTVNLAKTFIHDAALKVDLTGEVYCYGLTSNGPRGNIDGVFLTRFNEAIEPEITKKKEFLIMDLINLDKADAEVNFKRHDKKGLDERYVLCDMVRMDDGTMVITAEENFIQTTSTYLGPNNSFSNGSIRYNNTVRSNLLVSNDIVTVKITAKGEIEKINLVPKKQTSLAYRGNSYFNASAERLRESDLFLSHSYMQLGDDLVMFYNDHEDNFGEVKKRKTANRTSRMQPGITFVDEDLDYTVEPLFPGPSKFLIAPTRSVQLNARQYFISLITPNEGQKTIKIGVVTF